MGKGSGQVCNATSHAPKACHRSNEERTVLYGTQIQACADRPTGTSIIYKVYSIIRDLQRGIVTRKRQKMKRNTD